MLGRLLKMGSAVPAQSGMLCSQMSDASSSKAYGQRKKDISAQLNARLRHTHLPNHTEACCDGKGSSCGLEGQVQASHHPQAEANSCLGLAEQFLKEATWRGRLLDVLHPEHAHQSCSESLYSLAHRRDHACLDQDSVSPSFSICTSTTNMVCSQSRCVSAGSARLTKRHVNQGASAQVMHSSL